jgi:uncharacterized protein
MASPVARRGGHVSRTATGRLLFVAALLGLALLLVAPGHRPHAQRAEPLEDLARFPTAVVEIRTASGPQRFGAWVADTPARQRQGLMFVRELPPERGMLFVHESPQVLSMWMKNTYISLDMVFIGPDLRIVRVAPRTTPHSLATVSSGAPAIAVLELRAGEAERRQIRTGDKVSWSFD